MRKLGTAFVNAPFSLNRALVHPNSLHFFKNSPAFCDEISSLGRLPAKPDGLPAVLLLQLHRRNPPVQTRDGFSNQSMKKNDLIVLAILAAVLAGGLGLHLIQQREPPGVQGDRIAPGEAGYYGRGDTSAAPGPVTTVFWLSIDGVRPYYLSRAETPFLDRLMAEGAYSLEHEVVFPSLTFPTHVSQATGVSIREHGIPMNRFYDLETRRRHDYPGDSRLLEAEPIWITAARQGIRAASLDWVLAHGQTGEHTAEYFDPEFQRGLSDRERLDRLLAIWRADADPDPLRLVMGYIGAPDRAGHRYGPDSNEVVRAMEDTDALLREHYQAIVEHWETGRQPEDRLYFLITSDHGMSAVHTLINPYALTGLDGRDDVTLIAGGNVAHLYLDRRLSAADRENLLAATRDRLRDFDYLRAYRREELPPEWEYDHPTRAGDLVVVLDPGYSFSGRPEGIRAAPEDVNGPRGMHGYHPEENPDMLTIALVHRHPEPLGGIDLGPIHSRQLHPTVAALLGIDPADGADGEPIVLERDESEPGS